MVKAFQKGQALILVLLSLAVVLTLVLFILSRSVTDVAVSSHQEESARAFSAAEAGIEKGLVIGASGAKTDIGEASYKASIISLAEGSSDFNYPLSLSSGDTSTVWFSAHDANGNLICDSTHSCFTGNSIKVCWGNTGTSNSSSVTPAIEVTVFYLTTPGDFTTTKIARAVFDPNSIRRTSNSFSADDGSSCTISGVNYAFSKAFTFSGLTIPSSAYQSAGGLIFMRTRMLYNSDQNHSMGATVNFAGNSTLPSQGQNITSLGSAGDSNRKLQVFQGWPEIPSIFNFAIYTPTGVTK